MEQNKDIADIETARVAEVKNKKFILCFHDFDVKNCRKSAEQVRQIASVAGTPITVAVIPSVGGSPASEVESFRAELESLRSEGHELLLHGALHRADLSLNRNLRGSLALSLTHNEAEFAGLSETDSAALLDKAISLWQELGLDLPEGFVPPAWYGNDSLKNQVLAKFSFYEDRARVYRKDDLQTNAPSAGSADSDDVETILSPALSFAGIPGFTLGVAQTSACLALQAPLGMPRLVFHPVDFGTIGEKRILNLVRFAMNHREKVMYRDL